MLAAGIAREGGVVAEVDDRRHQHRQSRGDARRRAPAPGDSPSQRQVMAVLLGSRADRDDHGAARGHALGRLRPGQVLEPRPGSQVALQEMPDVVRTGYLVAVALEQVALVGIDPERGIDLDHTSCPVAGQRRGEFLGGRME